MLKVNVVQAGFTSNVFEQYNLPSPTGGIDTEVNGTLLLLFEDEQEAVEYLDELEDYAAELNSEAPEKPVLNKLIVAINNDEFVQAYRQ